LVKNSYDGLSGPRRNPLAWDSEPLLRIKYVAAPFV
jgi:hypothetical protein